MQTTDNPAEKVDVTMVKAFTPDTVLAWFSADQLKYSESARFLARLLHPEGPHCRKCGHPFTDARRQERWENFHRIQCPDCGSFCTAATGTILHKSEFEEREIILMAVGIALGVSDKALARLLACTSETVRTWRLKFNALAPQEVAP